MTKPAFESDEVTLRRRNRAFAAAALLLMIAGPALLVAVAVLSSGKVVIALAPLLAFLGLLLWNANLSPREKLGRLVANELGVFFDGHRIASLSSIHGGHVVLQGREAPLVRLTGRGPTRELRVKNASAGYRLLRAIHATRPGGARTLRLPSRVVASPGEYARVTLVALLTPALFPAIGLASHHHPGLFLALVSAAVAATAFVLFGLMAQTTLTLGRDGLRLAWLWRRRLLRYEDIDSARHYEEAPGAFSTRREAGLSIALRSGETLRLPAEGEKRSAELRGVAERIREALAGHGRGEAQPDEVLVARRGRAASAWLLSLRALGSGAQADHRTAPVVAERLWRLVEDETAAADARAGAAVALASSSALDPAGACRLRVAAESAASPRLRVALTAALDSLDRDEGELEHALAELEAGSEEEDEGEARGLESDAEPAR